MLLFALNRVEFVDCSIVGSLNALGGAQSFAACSIVLGLRRCFPTCCTLGRLVFSQAYLSVSTLRRRGAQLPASARNCESRGRIHVRLIL